MSVPCLRAQTFKTHQPRHTMPTTILTDLAQIVMNFAIAINTAALQPRVLDQTQQSLVVFSACRLRLRQPSVITTGVDLQRQAKPSYGIVARSLLDKVLLLHYSVLCLIAPAVKLALPIKTSQRVPALT